MKQLTIIFGNDWAKSTIIEPILGLHTDLNYLNRLTSLFGMSALCEQIEVETVETHFISILKQMQHDEVPNVRMNVAKTIETIDLGCNIQASNSVTAVSFIILWIRFVNVFV